MTKLVRVEPAPTLARRQLERLAAVPEEAVWLASQRSAATRRAYRSDVAGFLAHFGIRHTDELRTVTRAAVVAWVRELDASGLKPGTIARKLAALSSLFTHLMDVQVVAGNPCQRVKRPGGGEAPAQGTTPALSAAQARKLLDAPAESTLRGLRDRAILAVGLQTGARRSSICALRVRDWYEDAGYPVLKFWWKGQRAHVVAVHPETAQRITAYVRAAGIERDHDGPLFRPLARGAQPVRRPLCTDRLNRIVQRYIRKIGLPGRYSAHSMRATFVTRTLENGSTVEDVQYAAGHRRADTTKLYDRRKFNPARSAAFFATY